jgi:hypothetical protein
LADDGFVSAGKKGRRKFLKLSFMLICVIRGERSGNGLCSGGCHFHLGMAQSLEHRNSDIAHHAAAHIHSFF